MSSGARLAYSLEEFQLILHLNFYNQTNVWYYAVTSKKVSYFKVLKIVFEQI